MFLLRDIPKYETLLKHAERYPHVDPSAIETTLQVLVVARDVITAFEEHMAHHGLSQGRFTVLTLLSRDPEVALNPANIADRSGVTRATMTGLLDSLEKDGLAVRVDDPSDRRKLGVRLTRKGIKYLDKVMPDHFRRVAAMMGSLSAEERKTLMSLLSKGQDGVPAIREPGESAAGMLSVASKPEKTDRMAKAERAQRAIRGEEDSEDEAKS